MKPAEKEIYPSDMNDAQWAVLEPVLHAAIGRKGRISRREIVNAIFYVQRTGCQWRSLPKNYPKWKTVYSCFWRWQKSGVWDVVLEALRPKVRAQQGRQAKPTAASVDSQSVKTTEKAGHAALMATSGSVGASALC
jgi:putative transposase